MEYINIAGDQYDHYAASWMYEVDNVLLQLKLLFLSTYIMDYAIPSECEHFKEVIALDPETFEFIWIFNTMIAKLKWRYELALGSKEKFVPPGRILPKTVRTFNKGPKRMFMDDQRCHDLMTVTMREAAIVESYRRNAARVRMRMKPCRTKYTGICTQEYEKYLTWANTTLAKEINLPLDLARCIVGYVILDDFEHFEAVIHVDSTLFSFVFGWNDIRCRPNWHQDKISGQPYVPMERIFPSTVADFNDDILVMINVTLALAMYGNSGNFGRKVVCAQFRQNAARLTSNEYPIGKIHKSRTSVPT
jgi:hypothetical protein